MIRNHFTGLSHQPLTRPFRQKYWISGLLGTLVIILFVGLYEFNRFQQAYDEQRLTLSKELSRSGAEINDHFNQHLSVAEAVGAFIAMNPDLNQSTFARFTSQLINQRAIRHIAASREHVIRLIYPLDGNEQAVGLNIGAVPEQRAALEHARTRLATVLDGPVELVQGGQAMIARHPVFERSSGKLWGTVSLVMHYPMLIQQALDSITRTYHLGIHSIDESGKKHIFGTQTLPDPVTTTLRVGDAQWVLSAAPAAGWATYQPGWLTWLFGILTALLWWRLTYTHYHRHQLALRQHHTELRKARQFEQMFNQHSAIILTIDPEDGQILSANSSASVFYGYTESQLKSMNINQLNDLSDAEVRQRQNLAMTGRKNSFVFPHRLASGEIRNVEVHSSPITLDDRTILLSILHDVTERVEQEQKLKLDAKVFDNSQEAIMITDAEQRILAINPAFCRITGYQEAEVIGATPDILSSGRHDSTFYRDMYLSLEHYGHWRGEIWNRRKDGTIYPELLSISSVLDNDHRVSHYVAVFSDISSQKQSEEKLEQLAHYDLLTGLPNRLLLKSRMQHAIDSVDRNHSHLGVLFLDLDQFKYVNDSMGHACGDVLLQQVAKVLSKRVRSSDTLARLGGDEFVILLEDIHGEDDATQVAMDVINTLHHPFSLGEHKTAHIGVSIGISLYPEDASSSDELLAHADAAMYRAKSLGRNTHAFYTQSITDQSRKKQRIYGEFKEALQQDQLRLFYQPQIELGSGQVISAEALIRWQHPQMGLLTPNHFVPVAEERGLIHDLTLWVVEAACRQLSVWQAESLDLDLAVNVSPRDFAIEDFYDKVADSLARHQVPPARLHLELTENTLVNQPKQIIEKLKQFRELGVKLAIDDFGTGYASLSYLRSLPMDKLKIDRSFVSDITEGSGDTTIVRAVIGLSKAFNMQVIAEGVETPEQQQILKDLGCDIGQGYYYSKPVDEPEFRAFLNQWEATQ